MDSPSAPHDREAPAPPRRSDPRGAQGSESPTAVRASSISRPHAPPGTPAASRLEEATISSHGAGAAATAASDVAETGLRRSVEAPEGEASTPASAAAASRSSTASPPCPRTADGELLGMPGAPGAPGDRDTELWLFYPAAAAPERDLDSASSSAFVAASSQAPHDTTSSASSASSSSLSSPDPQSSDDAGGAPRLPAGVAPSSQPLAARLPSPSLFAALAPSCVSASRAPAPPASPSSTEGPPPGLSSTGAVFLPSYPPLPTFSDDMRVFASKAQLVHLLRVCQGHLELLDAAFLEERRRRRREASAPCSAAPAMLWCPQISRASLPTLVDALEASSGSLVQMGHRLDSLLARASHATLLLATAVIVEQLQDPELLLSLFCAVFASLGDTEAYQRLLPCIAPFSELLPSSSAPFASSSSSASPSSGADSSLGGASASAAPSVYACPLPVSTVPFASLDSAPSSFLTAAAAAFLSRLPALPHARSRCGQVWDGEHVAYRCLTCGGSQSSCICVFCFQEGSHLGHSYFIYRSSCGGCCDCGDASAWAPSGFCRHHPGSRRDVDPSVALPASSKFALVLLLRVLVRRLAMHALEKNWTATRELCETLLQLSEQHEGIRRCVGRAMLEAVRGTPEDSLGFADSAKPGEGRLWLPPNYARYDSWQSLLLNKALVPTAFASSPSSPGGSASPSMFSEEEELATRAAEGAARAAEAAEMAERSAAGGTWGLLGSEEGERRMLAATARELAEIEERKKAGGVNVKAFDDALKFAIWGDASHRQRVLRSGDETEGADGVKEERKREAEQPAREKEEAKTQRPKEPDRSDKRQRDGDQKRDADVGEGARERGAESAAGTLLAPRQFGVGACVASVLLKVACDISGRLADDEDEGRRREETRERDEAKTEKAVHASLTTLWLALMFDEWFKEQFAFVFIQQYRDLVLKSDSALERVTVQVLSIRSLLTRLLYSGVLLPRLFSACRLVLAQAVPLLLPTHHADRGLFSRTRKRCSWRGYPSPPYIDVRNSLLHRRGYTNSLNDVRYLVAEKDLLIQYLSEHPAHVAAMWDDGFLPLYCLSQNVNLHRRRTKLHVEYEDSHRWSHSLCLAIELGQNALALHDILEACPWPVAVLIFQKARQRLHAWIGATRRREGLEEGVRWVFASQGGVAKLLQREREKHQRARAAADQEGRAAPGEADADEEAETQRRDTRPPYPEARSLDHVVSRHPTSFHVPLNRLFAQLLKALMSHKDCPVGTLEELLDLLGVSLEDRMEVLEHHLRTLVFYHQVTTCSMWIRNGLTVMSEAQCYRRTFYQSVLIDLDLTAARIGCCSIPPPLLLLHLLARCEVPYDLSLSSAGSSLLLPLSLPSSSPRASASLSSAGASASPASAEGSAAAPEDSARPQQVASPASSSLAEGAASDPPGLQVGVVCASTEPWMEDIALVAPVAARGPAPYLPPSRRRRHAEELGEGRSLARRREAMIDEVLFGGRTAEHLLPQTHAFMVLLLQFLNPTNSLFCSEEEVMTYLLRHHLMRGPQTHSNLQDVVTRPHKQQPQFTDLVDRVLKRISTYRAAEGMTPGQFHIHPSSWAFYDPYFPYFSWADHQHIEEAFLEQIKAHPEVLNNWLPRPSLPPADAAAPSTSKSASTSSPSSVPVAYRSSFFAFCLSPVVRSAAWLLTLQVLLSQASDHRFIHLLLSLLLRLMSLEILWKEQEPPEARARLRAELRRGDLLRGVLARRRSRKRPLAAEEGAEASDAGAEGVSCSDEEREKAEEDGVVIELREDVDLLGLARWMGVNLGDSLLRMFQLRHVFQDVTGQEEARWFSARFASASGSKRREDRGASARPSRRERGASASSSSSSPSSAAHTSAYWAAEALKTEGEDEGGERARQRENGCEHDAEADEGAAAASSAEETSAGAHSDDEEEDEARDEEKIAGRGDLAKTKHGEKRTESFTTATEGGFPQSESASADFGWLCEENPRDDEGDFWAESASMRPVLEAAGEAPEARSALRGERMRTRGRQVGSRRRTREDAEAERSALRLRAAMLWETGRGVFFPDDEEEEELSSSDSEGDRDELVACREGAASQESDQEDDDMAAYIDWGYGPRGGEAPGARRQESGEEDVEMTAHRGEDADDGRLRRGAAQDAVSSSSSRGPPAPPRPATPEALGTAESPGDASRTLPVSLLEAEGALAAAASQPSSSSPSLLAPHPRAEADEAEDAREGALGAGKDSPTARAASPEGGDEERRSMRGWRRRRRRVGTAWATTAKGVEGLLDLLGQDAFVVDAASSLGASEGDPSPRREKEENGEARLIVAETGEILYDRDDAGAPWSVFSDPLLLALHRLKKEELERHSGGVAAASPAALSLQAASSLSASDSSPSEAPGAAASALEARSASPAFSPFPSGFHVEAVADPQGASAASALFASARENDFCLRAGAAGEVARRLLDKMQRRPDFTRSSAARGRAATHAAKTEKRGGEEPVSAAPEVDSSNLDGETSQKAREFAAHVLPSASASLSSSSSSSSSAASSPSALASSHAASSPALSSSSWLEQTTAAARTAAIEAGDLAPVPLSEGSSLSALRSFADLFRRPSAAAQPADVASPASSTDASLTTASGSGPAASSSAAAERIGDGLGSFAATLRQHFADILQGGASDDRGEDPREEASSPSSSSSVASAAGPRAAASRRAANRSGQRHRAEGELALSASASSRAGADSQERTRGEAAAGEAEGEEDDDEEFEEEGVLRLEAPEDFPGSGSWQVTLLRAVVGGAQSAERNLANLQVVARRLLRGADDEDEDGQAAVLRTRSGSVSIVLGRRAPAAGAGGGSASAKSRRREGQARENAKKKEICDALLRLIRGRKRAPPEFPFLIRFSMLQILFAMRHCPRYEAHWQQLDWVLQSAARLDSRVARRLRRWKRAMATAVATDAPIPTTVLRARPGAVPSLGLPKRKICAESDERRGEAKKASSSFACRGDDGAESALEDVEEGDDVCMEGDDRRGDRQGPSGPRAGAGDGGDGEEAIPAAGGSGGLQDEAAEDAKRGEEWKEAVRRRQEQVLAAYRQQQEAFQSGNQRDFDEAKFLADSDVPRCVSCRLEEETLLSFLSSSGSPLSEDYERIFGAAARCSSPFNSPGTDPLGLLCHVQLTAVGNAPRPSIPPCLLQPPWAVAAYGASAGGGAAGDTGRAAAARAAGAAGSRDGAPAAGGAPRSRSGSGSAAGAGAAGGAVASGLGPLSGSGVDGALGALARASGREPGGAEEALEGGESRLAALGLSGDQLEHVDDGMFDAEAAAEILDGVASPASFSYDLVPNLLSPLGAFQGFQIRSCGHRIHLSCYRLYQKSQRHHLYLSQLLLPCPYCHQPCNLLLIDAPPPAVARLQLHGLLTAQVRKATLALTDGTAASATGGACEAGARDQEVSRRETKAAASPALSAAPTPPDRTYGGLATPSARAIAGGPAPFGRGDGSAKAGARGESPDAALSPSAADDDGASTPAAVSWTVTLGRFVRRCEKLREQRRVLAPLLCPPSSMRHDRPPLPSSSPLLLQAPMLQTPAGSDLLHLCRASLRISPIHLPAPVLWSPSPTTLWRSSGSIGPSGATFDAAILFSDLAAFPPRTAEASSFGLAGRSLFSRAPLSRGRTARTPVAVSPPKCLQLAVPAWGHPEGLGIQGPTGVRDGAGLDGESQRPRDRRTGGHGERSPEVPAEGEDKKGAKQDVASGSEEEGHMEECSEDVDVPSESSRGDTVGERPYGTDAAGDERAPTPPAEASGACTTPGLSPSPSSAAAACSSGSSSSCLEPSSLESEGAGGRAGGDGRLDDGGCLFWTPQDVSRLYGHAAASAQQEGGGALPRNDFVVHPLAVVSKLISDSVEHTEMVLRSRPQGEQGLSSWRSEVLHGSYAVYLHMAEELQHVAVGDAGVTAFDVYLHDLELMALFHCPLFPSLLGQPIVAAPPTGSPPSSRSLRSPVSGGRPSSVSSATQGGFSSSASTVSPLSPAPAAGGVLPSDACAYVDLVLSLSLMQPATRFHLLTRLFLAFHAQALAAKAEESAGGVGRHLRAAIEAAERGARAAERFLLGPAAASPGASAAPRRSPSSSEASGESARSQRVSDAPVAAQAGLLDTDAEEAEREEERDLDAEEEGRSRARGAGARRRSSGADAEPSERRGTEGEGWRSLATVLQEIEEEIAAALGAEGEQASQAASQGSAGARPAAEEEETMNPGGDQEAQTAAPASGMSASSQSAAVHAAGIDRAKGARGAPAASASTKATRRQRAHLETLELYVQLFFLSEVVAILWQWWDRLPFLSAEWSLPSQGEKGDEAEAPAWREIWRVLRRRAKQQRDARLLPKVLELSAASPSSLASRGRRGLSTPLERVQAEPTPPMRAADGHAGGLPQLALATVGASHASPGAAERADAETASGDSGRPQCESRREEEEEKAEKTTSKRRSTSRKTEEDEGADGTDESGRRRRKRNCEDDAGTGGGGTHGAGRNDAHRQDAFLEAARGEAGDAAASMHTEEEGERRGRLGGASPGLSTPGHPAESGRKERTEGQGAPRRAEPSDGGSAKQKACTREREEERERRQTRGDGLFARRAHAASQRLITLWNEEVEAEPLEWESDMAVLEETRRADGVSAGVWLEDLRLLGRRLPYSLRKEQLGVAAWRVRFGVDRDCKRRHSDGRGPAEDRGEGAADDDSTRRSGHAFADEESAEEDNLALTKEYLLSVYAARAERAAELKGASQASWLHPTAALSRASLGGLKPSLVDRVSPPFGLLEAPGAFAVADEQAEGPEDAHKLKGENAGETGFEPATGGMSEDDRKQVITRVVEAGLVPWLRKLHLLAKVVYPEHALPFEEIKTTYEMLGPASASDAPVLHTAPLPAWLPSSSAPAPLFEPRASPAASASLSDLLPAGMELYDPAEECSILLEALPLPRSVRGFLFGDDEEEPWGADAAAAERMRMEKEEELASDREQVAAALGPSRGGAGWPHGVSEARALRLLLQESQLLCCLSAMPPCATSLTTLVPIVVSSRAGHELLLRLFQDSLRLALTEKSGQALPPPSSLLWAAPLSSARPLSLSSSSSPTLSPTVSPFFFPAAGCAPGAFLLESLVSPVAEARGGDADALRQAAAALDTYTVYFHPLTRRLLPEDLASFIAATRMKCTLLFSTARKGGRRRDGSATDGEDQRFTAVYVAQFLPHHTFLPKLYQQFYNHFLQLGAYTPEVGLHATPSCAVCVSCGAFLCALDCCDAKVSVRGASRLPNRVMNLRRHAITCGMGLGLYLHLSASAVYTAAVDTAVDRDAKWGCLHLDAYGEEDPLLKRGKPLHLSLNRLARLTDDWRQHQIRLLRRLQWSRMDSSSTNHAAQGM
ncbi:hypothetical protein BESB_065900 [Besnoitia besnoiti]|uniref:E3 ubiquitin-protein ligase n=1 Tax=Besnoitia besnoiti TaxID=94643 RepID=A0A2A9MG32_BESBE|nr:hypothetical protein BESB_065900 [Besnoitia besnoiti]PFH34557.1 hypothetical protein BESB_065900 [Besnoitia besnoiti]